MIKILHAAAGAALGTALSLSSFAAAAELRAPDALSDRQLDGVVSGVSAALAVGDGKAHGDISGGSTTTTIYLQSGQAGPLAAGAAGQVSASAMQVAGPLATASSTLSLSVVF
jgi:hypothetical protein